VGAEANNSSTSEDWRLQAELNVENPGGAVRGLVGRFRGPDVVKDVESEVPHDVVISHDGQMLFAYAPTQEMLASARSAIEEVLARDGVQARISVSHWDEQVDRWQQVDPPPSAHEERVQESARADDTTIETRTMVASSGRIVRSEFEQTMLAAASRLGLECKIVEHPHFLTTQIAFTVTGQRRKIEEFAQELRGEGVAMLRTDEWLVASPL